MASIYARITLEGEPLGNLLSGVGIAVEMVGIGLAGRGLYLTWKDNVPPEKQVSQLLRSFWTAVRRRLRRRTSVTAGVATARGVANDAHAVGIVTPPLRPLTLDLSRAELLDAISHNFEALVQMSVATQVELGKARHENAQTTKQLRTEVAEAHVKLTDDAKALVVEGVPLAVFGLFVTLFGLLLQGVGTFV